MSFACRVFEKGEDSAAEFLLKHKEEIAHVELLYYWRNTVYIPLEDCYRVEVYGDEYYYGAALFEVSELDEEYSFSGSVDDAIEYVKNYGIWDGVLDKKNIRSGVLFQTQVNDSQILEDPNEYDPTAFYFDVISKGVHFWKNNKLNSMYGYKGKLKKVSE